MNKTHSNRFLVWKFWFFEIRYIFYWTYFVVRTMNEWNGEDPRNQRIPLFVNRHTRALEFVAFFPLIALFLYAFDNFTLESIYEHSLIENHKCCPKHERSNGEFERTSEKKQESFSSDISMCDVNHFTHSPLGSHQTHTYTTVVNRLSHIITIYNIIIIIFYERLIFSGTFSSNTVFEPKAKQKTKYAYGPIKRRTVGMKTKEVGVWVGER